MLMLQTFMLTDKICLRYLRSYIPTKCEHTCIRCIFHLLCFSFIFSLAFLLNTFEIAVKFFLDKIMTAQSHLIMTLSHGQTLHVPVMLLSSNFIYSHIRLSPAEYVERITVVSMWKSARGCVYSLMTKAGRELLHLSITLFFKVKAFSLERFIQKKTCSEWKDLGACQIPSDSSHLAILLSS